MTESRLKLNADKTEFLIIGTHRQRDQIKTLFPIPLLNQHVMPAVSTRNLGVIFDDKLNFREHISQICRTCFYHIRDLHAANIRRYLPVSVAKTIATALVTSRLDYCNSLFHNIAIKDITKLQRVQNCLARVVTRSPRFTPSDLLFVPKVNTNMGTRAFAVGAPTLWNMLPSSVKSVENIAKFRRHLKTYLYNLAYPP